MFFRKLVQIVLFVMVFSTCAAFAGEESMQTTVELSKNLTLDHCIDLAIENNPDVQSSLFNTGIFKSRIGQAKSAYFPQIDIETAYSRYNSSVNNSAFDSNKNDFSTGISLNQLIYDFGRTPANVSVNKLNYEATREDLKNRLREVIFNVKKYYYYVLLKKKTLEVYEESVELYEKQLEQTNGLYNAGFKAKIDVITAEVNLNNAKLDLIRATNELEIAFANLNNAMGLPELSRYFLDGQLEYFDYSIEFDNVLTRAYDSRPDLKSIVLLKTSAQKTESYAKREYLPVVSGKTSFGARGNFPIDPSWSVGAVISVPVFNGLLTHNKIKEAKATVLKRDVEAEAVRQEIYLEIKQIYFNFQEIKQTIPVAELVVKQADERLRLAQKRYEIGVGNIIELKDAEVGAINAKISYLDALYQYNLAVFDVEKATGEGIPDLSFIF